MCAYFFVFFELCVAYANVKERLIVARAYIQRTVSRVHAVRACCVFVSRFVSFKDEKRTRRKKKSLL